MFERACGNSKNISVKRISEKFSEKGCVIYRYNDLFNVWFSADDVYLQRNVNTFMLSFKLSEFTNHLFKAFEEKFKNGFDEDVNYMKTNDNVRVG